MGQRDFARYPLRGGEIPHLENVKVISRILGGISNLFNPDDLHRAKIRSIPRTIVQICHRITLCNIPFEPEFLNYLTERIVRDSVRKSPDRYPSRIRN
jgi:hypothetical protein